MCLCVWVSQHAQMYLPKPLDSVTLNGLGLNANLLRLVTHLAGEKGGVKVDEGALDALPGFGRASGRHCQPWDALRTRSGPRKISLGFR